MQDLTKIELYYGTQVDACVILMHGLGDSAQGLSGLVDALDLPEQSNVRFVLPDAPMRHITINQGMRMRGWYDIKQMHNLQDTDMESIHSCEKQVHMLIQEQIDDGIPSDRIIIAGFSQGGVMALHVGLRYDKPLAGILALSCYLPQFDALPEKSHVQQHKTPISIQHGLFDPVVPLTAGKQAFATLKDSGYDVVWSEYPIEHGIHSKQISVIRQWILQQLD